MTMDVTVIVVNWNGEGLLRECLRSIRDVPAGLSVQTILVDNGSRDNSVQTVRQEFPEVELICAGRNLGFGAANNLALRQARGEFVMFLNPDARILPGSLQTICDHLRKNGSVGAVGCKMLNELGETQPLMTQSFPSPLSEFVRMFQEAVWFLNLVGLAPITKDPDTFGVVVKLSGGCLTVRRSLLDALGGFDERFFMYCEDGDLCQRIVLAGWELHYLADAAVTHVQGACSRKAPPGFSTLMQHESFYKYMAKYYGRAGAFRYRILICIGSLIRLSICCVLYPVTTILAREHADKWRFRLLKNLRICCWALGLARPTIPE